MKGAQSLSQFLTLALALTPLTSAWPGWLPDVDTLVVRQDDSSPDASATPTETSAPADKESSVPPTKTTDDSKATKAPESDKPQTTNLNTASANPHSNSTAKPTHKTYDAMDPAGGVAMITPATTAGTTLYRIGDPTPITWVWNYTSLQGTPTAIDVLVSCSTASQTWTLTQNMTFEPTATFTWDTEKYSESAVASPLLVAQYTLLIHDSDSSVDATAEAGYLAPFDGFQFGLYTARPYEDLGEWKCATCSGALGDVDRQAIGFAITMSIITVLSFTWYVTGIAALL
ncbi:uncharacterized protein F4812DRAFT_441196 [Daldinia caldariorum]|uniref:uncharacterized protein n=1 Tax=Daldinia caldariorum TaxID=326644 RepID=UPI002007F3F7|nr:uncharacterized protein F4812DRAFT_441196 [Daldinia caldariorum]KAI1464982.1 hypothetical protein F4812DRAFT_441196 [Daldinia caldariorum]